MPNSFEEVATAAGIIGGLFTTYQIVDLVRSRRSLKSKVFFGPTIEDIDDRPFRIEQATEADLDWIYTKSSELHGTDEASPLRQRVSWYHKNPLGVWVVRNSKQSICGSVEVFPVTAKYIDDLKNGRLHERNKTADDICSPGEDYYCLYIESVMAIDQDNQGNPWVLREIIVNAPRLLTTGFSNWPEKYIFNQTVEHYETKLGRRKSNSAKIIEKLGFTKIGYNTEQRVPIYSVLGENLRDEITKKFSPLT